MRKREIEKEEKAKLIMPDVVGEAIEDAEKILKEKNIEITEVKKKFDLFTKKDYVIKTEPEVGENVEDKVVVTVSRMKLLPLLLLCVLFAFGGIMFGTGTISRILTTSAPKIESKTHEWTKSGIVVVTKDAKMIDEVKNYEYCVTKRKTTIGCKWEKTETKNVEISKSGVWNVYFRGIDLKGRKSKVSNRDYVRVDNDAPIIEKVKSSIGTNAIILNVEARDEHSGVNTYYYKINDREYVLGEKEYTISNLEPSKEYKITIKVVDKVGNETEVEITITTLEDTNADNNNDGDNNNNNNDNNNNQNDNNDNNQEEVIEPPYIDLNEVPSILEYKEDHKLPSNYDFKNSTGTVSCKVGEVEYTNTTDLPLGNHTITCTATNKEGMSTTVSKDVYVKITDAEEEDLNGWIWLNLHYPANSTDWEWKKIDENEELVGDDLLWNEYTGPIRVRIEDIDKIYIRYKLDGNEVIISPDGYYVDIEPERGSIRAGETTKVKINYGTDVDKVEYKINNGVWQEYTEEFEVTANTRIDARIIYHIDVYDEDGNVLLQKPKKKTTTGYVKEIIDSTSGNNSGSGGDGCTDLCSCISGSWGVSMSSTSGYINNGKPVTVTIYYEEGAPIKQYKIGLYGEWRDYTGPITVSWDTYVSAKASGNKEINGCTKWVTGEKTIKIGQRWYGVRVEPDEHSIDSTQTTEVELYTWQRSARISLEYSINGGAYQPYRGVFRVGPNTTIVARASWVLDNGEILTEYGSDTVYENKNGLRTSVNPNTRAVGGLNKAYVGITTNLRAEKIEYTLDNGATWQDYKGTFAVDPNTLVCGRASKTNTDGSIQTSPPDCKWISEDDLGLTIYASSYAALKNTYVTATIGTRYSVEKIEYSLDNGNTWNEYTGKRIPVKAGNEIKAKAMYKGNTIYSSLPIEILPDSPEILPGPTINESPSNTYTREATISITTKYEARDIYYRINEGAWQKYTEPFKVNKNCKIESYYIRDEDGKTSMTTTFRVTNIRKPNYPYVRIDTDPKNYVNGTEESIKVSLYAEDYKTLEYSLDGIIYKPYTGEITISESTTVYALATNEYGSDEDELPIVTKTPTDPPEKLPVEIVANPDTKDLTDEEGNVKLVNKTEVSLIYGKEVTSACYKLGPSITSAKTREESEAINKTLANTPCVDYTGPFVVDKNTTVYAYVYNAKGFGSDQKMIDFLTLGIANPIISEEPTEATEIAKIKIDYSRNAIVKKYRIDNGPWIEYTDEFEVTANCEIEAINEDMLGNQATSTYKVTNIVKKPRYNLLNKGDYYLIKLNYPKNSIEESREYKWMTDGVWKKYDEHGILLIKPSAASKIITPDGVKIKDDQGNDVIITDHYYILSVDIDKVGENLYMKWDSAKVDAPKIIKSEDTETVTSMDVAISYNKALVTKLYRVIYDDGTDTGWIKYNGKFKVDKKGIVYAKGVDVEGNDSYVSSLRIDNIDSTGPVITVKGDMQTPKQKVTLLVSAKDDGAVDSLLYEEGSKNANYFKKNGKGLNNPSTITITENGKYTFYAVDNLGNETIKEIEITNIDKDAPDIEIKVLSTVIGTSTEVEIDYGDSVTTEYKIGEKGTYQNYTGTFTLSSYDLFELANEDGSLTIYAKGKDQAGNEKEVKEITYVLDLNKFETPNIVTSDGYPMLTSTGMVLGKPTYIEYDSKTTDVENYYRIDGGKWLPYTGGITFVSGHVEAKSIRESTGLEFTSEADVVVPTDAVGEKTYNENLEDYDTIAAGRSKKFTVSPNLVGRKIKIYTGSSVAANSTINVYDKNKKLLTSRPTVAVLTVLEVEEDAYLVEIAAGSSALAVREISLVSEGREIDSSYVPKITIDEANWALSKIATIKYYTEEYKNEYSIDNGTTWKEYEGPIRLEEPTNVIARTVDENGKVFGSSNFIITKIDTFTPEVELNFGNRIQKGYSINLPTYSKIGPSGGSVECKDGDTVVTNTNELEEGKHKITCIVKNNAGNKATVSKEFNIVETSDYSGESILKILEDNKDMPTGKFVFTANNETYPVNVITYDDNQIWKINQTFGDEDDVGANGKYAQNMVIVKVNGDLTINEGVTATPYSNAYGGPKGFTLYVTGKLTNNGTIDNSHGAYAEGQDVYLWKNADETYEYVPAVGATGGGARSGRGDVDGISGTTGVGRQTGGGGSGSMQAHVIDRYSGAGATGTSYSGGSGGGSVNAGGNANPGGAGNGGANGGAGGYGRLSGGGHNGYGAGGGAGNPGGSGTPNGSNGTGGLLVLYANEYENNGMLTARGSAGGSAGTGGGSSGGGSINIFTNQKIGIDQLGIFTDVRYEEILGSRSYVGGGSFGNNQRGGTGGTGTINIGEIRKGQYYDLREIIEQDQEAYRESVTVRGDSILSILNDNDLKDGYYYFIVNNENYPVHFYNFDNSQIWKENRVFGNEKDVATASTYAQNMVIVKVNGDLTINEDVTIAPYSNAYGGPKGFTLYVTGKLENNGTIDNSHGAKAEGQNVYLWKNADETYEYIPAIGATGGASRVDNLYDPGSTGNSGTGRQTGGGGSGKDLRGRSGAGGRGTSYSGGAGGGGSYYNTAGAGSSVGGAGGYNNGSGTGGGAGNPGSTGAQNGTGGLIVLYANEYTNNGTITANGSKGGNGGNSSGGSSGGGSINIFTNQETSIDQLGIITDTRYEEILGKRSYTGGSRTGNGGIGGTGTLNIGEIRKGQYYDLKEIIEQDKNSYTESVTIKGDSILSILNDNDLKSGYYYFVANGENYPVHLYTYDGNQVFTENQTFGNEDDVGANGKYAQNMVIVKVNGNLTIKDGVTISPYYTNYGGPKGFTLYVTGTLENNGTIDNSHGGFAEGQNVHLWKNTDGTYETVPAVGASGGSRKCDDYYGSGSTGYSGAGRQTGGGGSGKDIRGCSGNGGRGTSYSGGAGGGGSYYRTAGAGSSVGGAGGYPNGTSTAGGAGNPGSTGAQSGTGGLLIIYANQYINNGTISATGARGGSSGSSGGSSGGGSINIFSISNGSLGTVYRNGGSRNGNGGAGGTGTVTYTQLQPVNIYYKHAYAELTNDKFEKESNIITINYSSTLTKKLYSLDDGNTWLNYKKPFAANPNDKILAKGINKDDSETEVITYVVSETDGIPYNAYDGTTSEAATLEANKDYVFTVSSEVEGRNLRFFLGSEPSDDASIKVYDKTNKEVLSTTFVDKLTVINIPEGSYKFVVNGGSTELTINEINLREEKEIVNEIPIIETNDTAWSVNKIIDITYPEGYENEYSLDLGETWIKYEEPITIEKETIIFARTKKDGKVVTTNSYMINKVDAEEPTIELELENEYEYGTDVSIPTKYTVGKSLGTPICKTNDKEITNIKDLEKGTYEITCSITNGAKVTKEVSKEITINDYNLTNFDFIGDEETFIAPMDGKYKVETWGAEGGQGSSSGPNAGYGGYSKGTITLTKGEILYINIGGVGETSKSISSGSKALGGYNGGGYGTSTGAKYGSGGGGATHIALSSGILSTFENKINDLLIVSGGGGAGFAHSESYLNTVGSSGGGYKGVGTGGGNQENGGTQSGIGENPSFGQGGTNTEGSGGGGGYYGGGACVDYISCGGGSGYIGNSLLADKEMYCYNCEESDEESTKTISTTCVNESPTENCAKIGNGYARITYIGE